MNDVPQGTYSYTDDLGRTKVFRPVDDEAVVAFEPDATTVVAESLSRSGTGSVTTVNATAGFSIVRLGTDHTADQLAAVQGTESSLPVLLDEDGHRRYFVPGRLTVQFTDTVTDDEAQQVLTAAGSRVVVKQRTPGYYTVSVPEGSDLFATIRAFAARDDVVFAEPSEVGLDSELGTTTEDAATSTTTEVPEQGGATSTVDDRTGSGDGFDVPEQWEHDDDRPTTTRTLRTAPADGSETDGPEVDGDAALVPGYADFTRLWGLFNRGQTVNGTAGLVDADVDGTIAWDIHQGNRNVVVAVIDTGADMDHPDLQSQLLPRGSEDWDFADTDGVPDDTSSHGTHVAGTAVGNQNGSGVSGVAPGCRLLPLRVNLTSGMNQNRADAINYVAAQARTHTGRRYVVNCSWRMNGDHAGVRTAIRNAVRDNVVVVFAAGNSGNDTGVTPEYPGVYPEVIAVAATDQRDRRAGFSNYGTTVDVSAPGVNIWSSVLGGSHGFKDGTSMAAPHVAGVAALVWSRNPGLSNARVRQIVQQSADDIDARNPGLAGRLGSGRVNAYRALVSTPPPRLRATLVRVLPFPHGNSGSSSALSWVPGVWLPWVGLRPQLLFLTQQPGSERVHFLDPATGAVRRTVDPQANDTIGSMAWDGSAIRVANVTTGAGRINTIDPTTGAQTGSVPAPAGRGEGLAHEGGFLYYSTVSHIHKVRPSNGQVLWSSPAPRGRSRGLASGDGFLFSADSDHGVVTVFRPHLPGVVHGTVQVPGTGSRRAEGLAYDPRRNELYVADQAHDRILVLRVVL